MLEVEIQEGSVLAVAAEAIVNAANSQGWMGGGLARRLDRASGGPPVKRRAVLLGLLVAGVAVPAFAGPTPEEIIRAGTARLLDQNVSGAERAFSDLAEGPAAFTLPFFRGLITLARAEKAEDPAPALDAFLEEAGPTFEAAEAERKARPEDAHLHLFLGMAWGTRAMVEGARGYYLPAYRSLRRALERFEQAQALDPALADADYGLGLYAVSIAQVRGWRRPLVSLLLPDGDLARGEAGLHRAATDARFTADLAALALVHLRVAAERFAEALPFAERLAARYPGNPDFAFLLAFLYGETGRHPEAATIADKILAAMEAGHENYGPEMSPRYLQLLGKLAMDRGEYRAALAHFERAYAARTPRLAWVGAWAAARAGMVHDLLGEREAAVRRYQEALALEGDGPAHAAARRHLEEPYRGRVVPHP
jgi:tetratricopeptide (TPR) repeat protein